MSDFNLLGFLQIKVPNEPPAPITLQKQDFKILAPTNKFKEVSFSKTQGNVFTPPSLRNVSETKQEVKHASPFFRTTYASAYGSGQESSNPPEEEQPSTPTSISSASSVSSTISTCNDPKCDDCLNKLQVSDKKALAEAEKKLGRLADEEKNKQTLDELIREKAAEEEKKKREKQLFEDERLRVRAERAAVAAQHKRDEEDYLAMQQELSRVDDSAILAQRERNKVYLTGLQDQIDSNRARKTAEYEESKLPYSSSISIVDVDESRRAAQAEQSKEILRTLGQQIADKKAEGVAERAAENESIRRRQAADDAAFLAQQAAEAEKKRLQREDLITGNRDAINEKKAIRKQLVDEDRVYARQQRDAEAIRAEDERRRAEEKRRRELDDLHKHLIEQVQRRKDQQAREKEDELAYVPAATTDKKQVYVHCDNCERDLPPERFSNYIVTPNGKVYNKNKAYLPGSPLRKYLYSQKQPSAPYDFGHNNS